MNTDEKKQDIAYAFEGRLLPRQDEGPEDQGAVFDIQTVLTRVNRRRFLGGLGVGVGAFALAACAPGENSSTSNTPQPAGSSNTPTRTAQSSANYTEMPTETEGPYPGDGSNGPDVLEISGVERRDIRKSIEGDGYAEGVPVTITMTLIDMAQDNKPFENAAVYLWQANAEGEYSMYSDSILNETYLRGVQIADKNGQVTFESIIPGCYDGRWPHVHFEVFTDKSQIVEASNNILTSQFAYPQDVVEEVYNDTDTYPSSAQNLSKVTLETDNIFSDSWEQQMPTIKGSKAKGYTATIDIPIDTRTEQVMSMSAPGGGPGGAGGSGGSGGAGQEGGPGGGPRGNGGPGNPPPGRPGSSSGSSSS